MSDVLREYVRRLTDEDLNYLRTRFRQRLSGDISEIAMLLAKDTEVDSWLKEADGADEWFNMVDRVGFFVDKECERRNQDRRNSR